MPIQADNLQRHWLAPALIAIAALGTVGAVQAQDAAKTVVPVAASSPFQGLVAWLGGLVPAAATPLPARMQQVPIAAPSSASPATNFEPLPVIVGEPDVALVGPAPGPGPGGWTAALNYQGLQASIWVADKAGKDWQSRSLAAGVKVGERFKLLLTPSFDAQVQFDQILGSGWVTQRGAQVFPASGTINLPAGQAALVPAGDQMFTIAASRNPRFVMTVRHVKAQEGSRSQQPAYRRDAPTASHYVQLVPAGTYPWFEQVVGAVR